jgi:flavin-dependent dehydrogenase
MGANVWVQVTVTRLERGTARAWTIHTSVGELLHARFLVAADGRNSSVAKLLNLSRHPRKERVALQTHLPLPPGFGRRAVLQLLPGGYSGQAPVDDTELNLCLVSAASGIETLKQWALSHFGVAPDHPWRSVTPLARDAIPPAHPDVFLAGDAARIVEPFTGEGIYYAMATGELAAETVARILCGENEKDARRDFSARYRSLYRGRLWINRLARAAVLSPRLGNAAVKLGRIQPWLLRLLTAKVVSRKSTTSP